MVFILPRIQRSQRSNLNIDITAMKSAGRHRISLGRATGACGGDSRLTPVGLLNIWERFRVMILKKKENFGSAKCNVFVPKKI